MEANDLITSFCRGFVLCSLVNLTSLMRDSLILYLVDEQLCLICQSWKSLNIDIQSYSYTNQLHIINNLC